MLRIKLYNFGKIKNSSLRELEDYYLKLSKKYLQIEIVELKDVKKGKIVLDDIKKQFDSGFTIILSEEGKEFTTKEFVKEIRDWKLESREVRIFVGNAFGFEEEVKTKSDLVFSLSKLTLPHEFVRVLLLEQLFRVGDILAGGKYHK